MARRQQHHISGWPAILLAPLAVPLILGILLLQKLSILKKTVDLTADDVAGYLEEFVEGKGGPWDWDDFTSIPITDPQLEAIRIEALFLDPPLDEAGEARLRGHIADLRRDL